MALELQDEPGRAKEVPGPSVAGKRQKTGPAEPSQTPDSTMKSGTVLLQFIVEPALYAEGIFESGRGKPRATNGRLGKGLRRTNKVSQNRFSWGRVPSNKQRICTQRLSDECLGPLGSDGRWRPRMRVKPRLQIRKDELPQPLTECAESPGKAGCPR